MIEIKRMDHLLKEGRDILTEAAIVFVDAYYRDLGILTSDREKLVLIFKEAFVPQTFYVALMDGDVAGILACANNKARAMHIPKETLTKQIGWLKGNLLYRYLRSEFHTPLAYPDDTAYIEAVATHTQARGKGVATRLLEYVMKNLPYQEFRLTVTDRNKVARHIYATHGFVEIDKLQASFMERKYFNYKLYMKLDMTQATATTAEQPTETYTRYDATPEDYENLPSDPYTTDSVAEVSEAVTPAQPSNDSQQTTPDTLTQQ